MVANLNVFPETAYACIAREFLLTPNTLVAECRIVNDLTHEPRFQEKHGNPTFGATPASSTTLHVVANWAALDYAKEAAVPSSGVPEPTVPENRTEAEPEPEPRTVEPRNQPEPVPFQKAGTGSGSPEPVPDDHD